jgi:hypothetical protein
MKTRILSILLLMFVSGAYSQTASNFTVKDCAGKMHDLYSELDSGKVVVINWVMPCGACVPASLTTFSVVQDYQLTNPDKVRYYLVDDLANTSCSSLNSWAAINHINPPASFSDAAIDMLDYGTQAMPKVVVLAGGNHHVFMVADAVLEAADLQASINAALVTAAIPETEKENRWIRITPNPAKDKAELKIKAGLNSLITVRLFTPDGGDLGIIYQGIPTYGESQISIDLSQYTPGIYFVRVNNTERTETIKLTLQH